MSSNDPCRILFVCMGNICRSPLAEGVFLHLARQRGAESDYVVDSAGTGAWHVGKRPDERSLEVARAHGVEIPGVARQVEPADFRRFDMIVCMDDDNRHALLDLGAPPDRLRLLLEFDPAAPAREVPDPYLGTIEDFEHVYLLIEHACTAMLEQLRAEAA